MKIGIIGGSGLDDPNIFFHEKEESVITPYGAPSSEIKIGKILDVDVCLLARHGKKHTIPPTHVNNRANIFALKKLGCTHIISTTAVGSLKEEIKPGDLVILNQFIDFTKNRIVSFYDNFEKGIEHASLAEPFSEEIRNKIISAISGLGYRFHKKGTVITIEGARFSTKAESNLFRQWGADVINMSIAPEAILARESGLEYASIAMSTDYDCWKEGEENVTADMVFTTMRENAEKVKKVLVKTIELFSKDKSVQDDLKSIKDKIRTIPDFPKPGIMFRDITTLFKDKEGIKKAVQILYERYKNKGIDIVVGIESRGFIIGGILAEKLNCGFVPIRKKGKLPAETISESYELEYGGDTIEIHKDAIIPGQKILLIDDLIATSGTMVATCKLIEKLGGNIVECAVVIELEGLNGREKLKAKGNDLFSLIKFKENE